MSRTVVLGLGNALLGDEGIGVTAVARLRDEWHFSPVVDLIDANTWNDSLMDVIESATAVLIVTALDMGLEPGQVAEISGAELPRVFEEMASLDRLDLGLALAIASWRGKLPPNTILLAVQPHSIAPGTLSPRIGARVDVVLFKIIRRLESWQHACWRSAPLGVHAHA